MTRRGRGVWAAAALAVAGAPALAAAQPVASGDCARVRRIAEATPVTQRFAGRYRGVLMVGRSDTACGRDYLRAFALDRSGGAAGEASFTVAWYGVMASSVATSEQCPAAQFWNLGTGTMRVWQAVSEANGLCDLTIRLRLKVAMSSGWSDERDYVVAPQGERRFVATPANGAQGEVIAFYRE